VSEKFPPVFIYEFGASVFWIPACRRNDGSLPDTPPGRDSGCGDSANRLDSYCPKGTKAVTQR